MGLVSYVYRPFLRNCRFAECSDHTIRPKVQRVSDFYRVNVRVHWADTDAAGIVWFGNFLRFFEEAEDEMFRALGRTRLELVRDFGILMPRLEAACRFRSPARAEEVLPVGISCRTDRAAYQVSLRSARARHAAPRLRRKLPRRVRQRRHVQAAGFSCGHAHADQAAARNDRRAGTHPAAGPGWV